MSNNGWEVVGVSSEGPELEDVRDSEGIRVVSLEMTRIISPLKDIKSLYNFYKLCKKEKPIIVHSHTPKAGIVGMLAAKLAGVPLRLHTVAGLPLMEARGVKRKVLNAVERLTYACATNVYPNSKGLYEFILKERLGKPSKLKVIANGSSNGIDTGHFSLANFSEAQCEQLRNEWKISKDDFVFIFVGRLVGDKGINELIKAFGELEHGLAQGFKTVKLLLVGDFESALDPLLPATLDEIRRNSDIVSVGFQNDVRPFFAISDCLVFPSYREGFPNVVMQAGAMRLPSIVSNINGCNEIIEEGVNGTIVPVKSVSRLTVAMQKMIEDKEYYLHLKSKAREMIVNRYEQQVVWEALLNEYRRLEKQMYNRKQ
ncbi:glycosyltransferase family 4 protein [Olivibacter sp. LS-1]|nr:glycosyltransferase family 4 protein [Olivibacter sp. LS-1]